MTSPTARSNPASDTSETTTTTTTNGDREPSYHSFIPVPSQWASPITIGNSFDNSRTPNGTAISRHHCLSSIEKEGGRILSIGLVYLEMTGEEVVYAGTDSRSVRIWKLPCFTEFGKLKSGSKSVDSMVVSSQHGLVFTAHSDRKIRVWTSSPANSRRGTLPSLKDSFMESLVNQSAKISIFRSIKTGTSTQSPSSPTMPSVYRDDIKKSRHSGFITSMAYDPMNNLLYSGSKDHTIKVWNIGGMKIVKTIQAHSAGVNSVVVGPDGLVCSGSDDRTIKIWQMNNLTEGGSNTTHSVMFFSLKEHRSTPKSLVVGGEGRAEEYILYAGCSDGYLHFWKLGLRHLMEYMGFVRAHNDPILCLAAVGKLVVTGSVDGGVRVWCRTRDGHRCIAILEGHVGPVKAVAVRLDRDSDGCMVYSGGCDGFLKQWWVSTGLSASGAGGNRSDAVSCNGAGCWHRYRD